jgi:hypothetical protein
VRRVAIPLAVVLVVMAGVTALWLRPGRDAAEPGPGTEPSTAPVASMSEGEAVFINATAAQLCAAQSKVYENPEALAAAYAEPPAYTGLTPEEVATYRARLNEDVAFSNQLATTLADTCRPDAAPATTP